MRIRRITAALLAAALFCAVGFIASTPAEATVPTCFGSVGCGGSAPSAGGCAESTEVVEAITVQNLGQLVLYKSSMCPVAWATLTVGTGVDAGTGAAQGWHYIAEIFYEPPNGGPEQFQVTSPWGGTGSTDVLTTNTVPDTGSFKTCAGSPGGSADPFDEDPEGTSGSALTETQLPSYYNIGACTMWH